MEIILTLSYDIGSIMQFVKTKDTKIGCVFYVVQIDLYYNMIEIV